MYITLDKRAYRVCVSFSIRTEYACVFYSVIYKLLASKSEGIRVQALKVLGYFLRHLSQK